MICRGPKPPGYDSTTRNRPERGPTRPEAGLGPGAPSDIPRTSRRQPERSYPVFTSRRTQPCLTGLILVRASGQAQAVADHGAPTSKWRALPGHLDQERDFDLRTSGAQLVVRRPDVPDVTITVEKTELVIGRDVDDVDLTLDDELVSRRHARLMVDERGYFTLEDLGSTNGIEYAGRPVRRLNLVDGDEFIIGKAHFRFVATMERFSTHGRDQPKPAIDPLFEDIQIPEPQPDPEDDPHSADESGVLDEAPDALSKSD